MSGMGANRPTKMAHVIKNAGVVKHDKEQGTKQCFYLGERKVKNSIKDYAIVEYLTHHPILIFDPMCSELLDEELTSTQSALHGHYISTEH